MSLFSEFEGCSRLWGSLFSHDIHMYICIRTYISFMLCVLTHLQQFIASRPLQQFIASRTVSAAHCPRSTMPTSHFCCDDFVVASNGIDDKAYVLPSVTCKGKKFVLLSYRNPQLALFLTGRNVSSRPFTHCSLREAICSALAAKHGADLQKADGMEHDHEALEPDVEVDIPAHGSASFKTWAKHHPFVEIELPKAPGSYVTRVMLIRNHASKLSVHATDDNLSWIFNFVRSELGLPSTPVRKRRRTAECSVH